MAKKMSVADILAAARAEKAKDAAAATGDAASPAASEPPATPAEPVATPPLATSESVSEGAPAAETPAAEAPKADAPKRPAAAMSVAEIMAAARAAKAGAAPAAPAAKSTPAAPKPTPAAEAKPAAKAETPAAPSGPKDTASILAAARKAAKPGPISKAEAAAKAKPTEPAGKKKIEVPPMPAKPDYAKAPAATASTSQARRNFLAVAAGFLIGSPLAIGFTTLAVTHLMWLLGLARFMFPNVLIEPPTRFKVGFPDALAPGQVETKFIPQFGVWIVRYEYEGQPMIYALKAVCTHLGCTPNWLEAEQKFKCPCHGSGFYKDGVNFEGPAPRPLERYAISIADDGQLLVDKSRSFNQELGGWADPASYVNV